MSTSKNSSPGKKIVWISALILDMHLHKTSQIQVLQELAKRKNKVFLVASHSSRKDLSELAGVPTISIPLRHVPFFSSFAYALLLSLYLPIFFLRSKPDIVVVEPNVAILSLAPTLLFPKSQRPKLVLDIRSTPVKVKGFNGSLNILFFNISVCIAKGFFQGITTLTPLMRKEICERFAIDARSVGVWTSGVSTIIFNPENFSGSELREKFGLKNSFVVFYHGVIGEKRGIIETVKALNLLKNEYPALVLFLLGKAVFELGSVIKELGIENMVMVHESVSYEQVPNYIAMCDVGIIPLPNLPYWRHQSPLKLLEYLAMKKVVIATDIPANREVIGTSKCGIYISSADPKEIADAIICAYDNKEKLGTWGVYGRMVVEERYSWKKVAEDFEDYLLSLFDSGNTNRKVSA